MLGTWIIFDNDRFDLDGAVKLKLQEALVVGWATKKGSFTGCKWNRQL
jgi:hypothetical protein